jgi:hypothetical protein
MTTTAATVSHLCVENSSISSASSVNRSEQRSGSRSLKSGSISSPQPRVIGSGSTPFHIERPGGIQGRHRSRLPHPVARAGGHRRGSADPRTDHTAELWTQRGVIFLAGADRFADPRHGLGDQRAADDLRHLVGVRADF